MITSIEIDGFKSLRNFKMEFRKGLNVLAGPNGSGKTNILQALEFLRLLLADKAKSAIEEAVDRFGDILDNRNTNGIVVYDIVGISGNGSHYQVEIVVSVEDMMIESVKPSYQETSAPLEYLSWHLYNDDKNDNGYILHQLAIDIANIAFFTIDPEVSKRPSNKKYNFSLDWQGKYLSKTIYDILEPRTEKKDAITPQLDLYNFIELLFPSLATISAFTRAESSDVGIDFTFGENGVSYTVGLGQLSSGEVTWIAISTILASHRGSYLAFDEPDRHLHPDMVQKMISLFREHAEQGPGWLLMTTHNVAAIDLCDIDELQIVGLNEEGHTRVRPVRNPENLEKVMYKYGRSLGSFYVSGSL